MIDEFNSLHSYLYRLVYHPDHSYKKIKSIIFPNINVLHSPLPYNSVQDFTGFIINYIDKFRHKPIDLFYTWWYKMQAANQNYNENLALVQCTAIESVLNKYFSSYGIPSKEDTQDISKAIELINVSELNSKSKKRFTSTLTNFKKQSPRNALNELYKQGLIEKEMVQTWIRQRNSLTHGTIITTDNIDEYQKSYNETRSVLALFYRLLLIHIRYELDSIDYSKESWPRSKINYKK